MFVAKFQQVTSDKFEADKNNNMPFIGQVLAGRAIGTVINGTMFQREGLLPNKVYLCQNTVEDYEGTDQVRTSIVSEVSLLELNPLMTQLGPAKLELASSDTPE